MSLWRGITISDCSGIQNTVGKVKALGFRPVVRVVLDPGLPLAYYDWRVRQLSKVADVMIQFGTADHVRFASFESWKAHVDRAFGLFFGYAKYWEVAHEPNQSELKVGRNAHPKYHYALELCRSKSQTTVATYLTGGKADTRGFHFKDWITANPLKVDVVLASFYPWLSWPAIPQSTLPAARAELEKLIPAAIEDLKGLRSQNPEAKIGWGATGGKTNNEGKFIPFVLRAEVCRQLYGAKVDIPNFIGGVFYWDFVRDCVKNPDAAETIFSAIKGVCHASGTGEVQRVG